MNKKIILSALMCFFQVILVQSRACNCGLGSGRNICSAPSCQPQVVRAQPLQPIPAPTQRVVCQTIGVKPLKPIGDLCSCGQTIIKPATVPKPSCSGCACGANKGLLGLVGQRLLRNSGQTTYDSTQSLVLSNSQGLSPLEQALLGSGQPAPQSSQGLLGGAITGGGISLNNVGLGGAITGGGISLNNQGYEEGLFAGAGVLGSSSGVVGGGVVVSESGSLSSAHPSGIAAAADPISQALALSLVNNNNFAADSKLSFGFSKLPSQLKQIKINKPTIPEENLQGMNGPVLELKLTPAPVSVDQEALNDLMEADDDIIVDDNQSNGGAPRSLTMGELGYKVEKGNSGNFINLNINSQGDLLGLGHHQQNTNCNDGFQSGQVIIGEAPVSSQVTITPRPSPPCTADEVQQNKFLTDLSLNPGSAYSSYSSSQSYNSDSSHSNVLLQKLGLFAQL